MSLSRTPGWQALRAHADTLAPRHLRQLFADGDDRFTQLSLRHGDLL
ncbi:MAG: hypothetical protein RIR00_689, partial [Pseudomonadota bacterium]